MKLNPNYVILLGILIMILSAAHIPAPKTELNTHRYIVQLSNNHLKANDIGFKSLNSEEVKIELIFPSLSIYSVIIHTNENTEQVEKKITNLPGLLFYEKDVKTTLRSTTPDDIDFTEQWNLNLINAPEAWDKTTGGKTKTGHDIVVAIIDNGYDLDHEDLVDNIWINEAEIPGNGIDDDENGFTDDYLAVNTKFDNGDIPERTHGTGVAGIIGAKGNNRLGISGVNWNVKLMLITGQAFVADIIKSYNYALTQRLRFNASNGEEGALVVATNFSSGIDEAFAIDFPIWCSVYDELGQAGVLNVTAAPNNGQDVDQVGDMPSTCPSEYLIVVNNVDRNDELVSDSGFGTEFTDIAAPGDDALTISIENSYDPFNGTSSSSPHVAGAIALMYAVDRTRLGVEMITKPEVTAINVKNALYRGSSKKEILTTRNSTGGRLDLEGALFEIEEFYDSDKNFALTLFPNPVVENRITVNYLVDEMIPHYIEIYDRIGRRVHIEQFNPETFDPFEKELILNQSYYQGLYFLSVRTENKTVTKSFFVP